MITYMIKKKYILVVGIIILGVFSLVLLNNKLDNKETKLDEVKLKENKVNNKGFAIMIQKEDKTGYEVYEESSWPTNMIYNNELSGCIDNYGSIVENSMTYNKDTNKITIDTGVTSSCYVYFDIESSKPLGQYIIDNSISGLDKNLIGTDTLYRFSGTSGNTGINNYICLGTTSKCASGSDNMYRIIGVEPSTGYVKIIKETKYGSNIYWDSNAGVTWPNSGAYSTLTTWYNSVSFKSMIVSHSWNIGDFTSAPTTRANSLSADASSTTTAYVGMLAVSDYYLAYRGDQNWNSSYSNYTSNWIHLTNNGNTSDAEWTMSRYSIDMAWRVIFIGRVDNIFMPDSTLSIRPVFYLNSTVNRISGSGTSGDPFIVG